MLLAGEGGAGSAARGCVVACVERGVQMPAEQRGDCGEVTILGEVVAQVPEVLEVCWFSCCAASGATNRPRKSGRSRTGGATTATASTAAATAKSTPPSTALRSRAPAATPRPAPTSPARPPKARPPAKRSTASSATSPAASGTCSSRPTRSQEHRPHHQSLDIEATRAAVSLSAARAPTPDASSSGRPSRGASRAAGPGVGDPRVSLAAASSHGTYDPVHGASEPTQRDARS